MTNTTKPALSAAPVAQEPVAQDTTIIALIKQIEQCQSVATVTATYFDIGYIDTIKRDALLSALRKAPPATPAGVGADEIAAYLFARDESYPHEGVTPALMEWGRLQVRAGKDAAHDGDCTKKPFSCARCAYDVAIRDANAILALLSRGSGDQK